MKSGIDKQNDRGQKEAEYAVKKWAELELKTSGRDEREIWE